MASVAVAVPRKIEEDVGEIYISSLKRQIVK